MVPVGRHRPVVGVDFRNHRQPASGPFQRPRAKTDRSGCQLRGLAGGGVLRCSEKVVLLLFKGMLGQNTKSPAMMPDPDWHGAGLDEIGQGSPPAAPSILENPHRAKSRMAVCVLCSTLAGHGMENII